MSSIVHGAMLALLTGAVLLLVAGNLVAWPRCHEVQRIEIGGMPVAGCR